MKLETIVLLVLLYFSQTNAYIDRSSSNTRDYQIQSSDFHRRQVRHIERLKEFRFQQIDGKFDDERRLYSRETADFADNVDRNNNIIGRQRIPPQQTYRSVDERISGNRAVRFAQRHNLCTESLDRRSHRFSEAICLKRRTNDISIRIEKIEMPNHRLPENRKVRSERSIDLRRRREVQMSGLNSMRRRSFESRIDRTRHPSEPGRNTIVDEVNNNFEIVEGNIVQRKAGNTKVHREDRSRINNHLSPESRYTSSHSSLRRLETNIREVGDNSRRRRALEFRADGNKMSTSHRLQQRESRYSFNLQQINERRNKIVRDVHTVPVLTTHTSKITSSPMTDRCSPGNKNAFNSDRFCEQRQERNIRDISFESSSRILTNSRSSDNKRSRMFERRERSSSEYIARRLPRLTEDRENNVRNRVVTTFSPINVSGNRNSINAKRLSERRQDKDGNETGSKLLQSRISETPDRRLIDHRNSNFENRNIRVSNFRLNQRNGESDTNGIERGYFRLTNRRLLQNRSNTNLQFADERRERTARQTGFKQSKRFSSDIQNRHDKIFSMSGRVNRRSSENANNLIQRRISEANIIRTYRFPISHRIERTPVTNRNSEQRASKLTRIRERSRHEHIAVTQEQINRSNRKQRLSTILDYNRSIQYRIESRRDDSQKREDAQAFTEKQLGSIQEFSTPSQNRIHTEQQRTQRVDGRNIKRESPREIKSYQTLKRVSNTEFIRKSKNLNEDNKDNRTYLEKTEREVTTNGNYRSVPRKIQIRHENTQTNTVQSITSADRAVFRRQIPYQSLSKLQRNDRKDTQNRNRNSLMSDENTSDQRRSIRDRQIENHRSYIFADKINQKSSYEDSPVWLNMAKLIFLSISIAQILCASNPKLFR